MKYLTIENKSLQDVDTSNYRKVTWGCYNFKTNTLTLCGQEDEYINGQYPKKPIVTNFNLDTGEKEIILKSGSISKCRTLLGKYDLAEGLQRHNV